MTITVLLLLVHAGATWTMVGVIWVMQLVHYPLFALVGQDGFPAYERRHQAAITWIVGPAMLLELGTAVLLATTHRLPAFGGLAWVGLALVLLNALLTATVQGPLHGRLAGGFDGDLHRRLVRSNWVRTAAWSVRGPIALAMLVAASGAG